MKALRYLLSMIAVVSVLSVSAQTPNYGKPYKGQEPRSAYMTAQMPAATMGSVNTGYVRSNTALPFAAQTGVVTTYDKSYAPTRPRREGDGTGGTVGGDDDWSGDDNNDPEKKEDEPFPIGDGLLPLMLLAAAMAGVIALRRRKKEEKAV